jgi:hypothetical protein
MMMAFWRGGGLASLLCILVFGPLGRDQTRLDEAIHRIRVSAHSGMRRPPCRPPHWTPLSCCCCCCSCCTLLSGGPRHKPSVRHTIAPCKSSSDFEILQRTLARPHTRTPAPLSKSVPHNESAQATLSPWALAVPKPAIIITVVSRWYYFYICLPPPLNLVPLQPNLSRSFPVSRY